MKTSSKESAILKIHEMTEEQVAKLLIFMAGMEAEHNIKCRQKMKCICQKTAESKTVSTTTNSLFEQMTKDASSN